MLMAIRRKTKIIQGRRSDRLLDDKRKAPCCLMAAWGFAMVGMPDQVGDDGRAGHDGGELAGEVFCDAFHMRINDSLLTSSAL